MKKCGNPECATSTFIDEVTTTHGWGELYEVGVFEFECPVCTAVQERRACFFPDPWPNKPKNKEGSRDYSNWFYETSNLDSKPA